MQELSFHGSRSGKDPSVETGFLPDRVREGLVAAKRAALEAEWEAKQKREKAGKLEVTYSYWDGSGHRRTLRLVKGDTIANFLTEVQRSLGAEFPELRGMRPDSLVCVRPALILFPSLLFVILYD